MSGKLLLEVNELTKAYGEKVAVSGLSFTLCEGSVCGFLGPNGAGKTTAMNMIAGALYPDLGRVVIAGHDLLAEPGAAKAACGYLPENVPVFPDMTVAEYLRYSAELKGLRGNARKSAVDPLIPLCALSGYEHKLMRTLSKGYRQRCGLAQAMLGGPPLLILDEPMSGLDPRQIREMRELIRAYGKHHAVLLSSHILSEVWDLCDRFLIIADGCRKAFGTGEEILALTGGKDPEAGFPALTGGKDGR